jgi:hypothetical protein
MSPEGSIYDTVPGGAELVRWFGQVPTFHDAEILALDLRRRSASSLKIHGWISTGRISRDGTSELDKHAVVTFAIESVMDLKLDGFSPQNVINGLVLRRAAVRPDRRPFLSLDPLPEDVEIELEPSFGLEGFVRARSVSITFVPGKPSTRE